ncbi:MAG: hypothetical protein NTW87_10935 [Planctomycetota bacterium]|nr:hypothetical protein [Planctomycetota bacterium]
MASASGIRAGAAYVELLVHDSALVRGLKAASAKLRAFGATVASMGTGLMTAGAAIVTPLLASVKAFAETGDKLDEMSARTGVSVEALSEFEYAASLSGSSLEDMEGSVRKMQASIVKAGDGSKQATEAFARLGLGVRQLQGLSPEDQFALIAQRLMEIKDPTDRAATAMQIFGRSGTALLPMMKDLPALREEARKLGLVWSTEDAKAAGVLSDAMTSLWASLKRIVTTIGAALAPFVLQLVKDFQKVATAVQQWLSRNRGLVVSALKLGVILAAAGAALFVLGKAFMFVAAIVGGIATVFTAVGSIIAGFIGGIGTIISVVSTVAGAVGTAFTAISAAIAAVGAPVLIVIAALAALAVYALYASGVLESAWTAAVGAVGDAASWLQDRFAELKEFATTTFKGIADALAAGDVALAARIMWLGIQVAWFKGLAALALDADKTERTQREAHAKELADAEAALDAARNEWLGAIVEAGQKRREVETNVPPAARQLPETALPAVEQAVSKFDVVGTFSAMATFGMGIGGSAAERTAKSSEETARNTKRILDEVQSGEATFE